MSQDVKVVTAEEHFAKAKASRPKPGTYPTFTSRRGESIICFQKVSYISEDKGKSRKPHDTYVRVVIQKDVEFDAYAACLGSVDGKTPPSPAIHKFVKEGYLCEGKKVFLSPKALHEFVLSKQKDPNSSVILWTDRPRPEAEVRLEKALNEKQAVIDTKEIQMARLADLLKGKVNQADIDKIMGDA